MVIVGVDTGGTFTDFVVIEDGALRIHKESSTPEDPARAILCGLERLGLTERVRVLVHGTTVATNAVLERRGAHTGLVTTAGFRDVLEIGRQNRPKLYDLQQTKPPPLVPREWRLEVRERMGPGGEILVPLHEEDVERAVSEFLASGVESVAVVFLYSFVNPEHEARVAARLRQAGFWVSASHEVLPEYREYERTSTTVINAYVGPIIGRYVRSLTEVLADTTLLRIMQSNGGVVNARTAAAQAVRTILSGPAAGVVGARAVAQRSGFARVISFDMGGTSTDVCLIDGQPEERSEGRIGAYPVRLPMLDIHTVGAGGGSLAWFDRGGALRVGPRSAGAWPGPAAYGRGGEEATVTDAAVVLGWIPPEAFLGGTMPLDQERATAAVARVARELGSTLVDAALGIVEVAEATMEGAIRVISVERGYDPREFTLVAFGGAGPVFACRLAQRLHIPRVLVPPHPGVLSAHGLIVADLVRDYVRTIMTDALSGEEAVRLAVAELEAQAISDLAADGELPSAAQFETALDLRYAGQSYELAVPYRQSLAESIAAFHRLHERRYGFAAPGEPVTVVNVRLRAIIPSRTPLPDGENVLTWWEPRASAEYRVIVPREDEAREEFVPGYRREDLRPGALLAGPAIVTQYDTTIVIPPRWRGYVDGTGALVLERSWRH